MANGVMAGDCIVLVSWPGFDHADVIGHDRGGRVTIRTGPVSLAVVRCLTVVGPSHRRGDLFLEAEVGGAIRRFPPVALAGTCSLHARLRPLRRCASTTGPEAQAGLGRQGQRATGRLRLSPAGDALGDRQQPHTSHLQPHPVRVREAHRSTTAMHPGHRSTSAGASA